jgi:drug/metabolite transporter (DMT)-like permease
MLIPLAFIFEDLLNTSATNQSIIFIIVLGILNTAIGGLIFFKLIKLSGAAFTSTVNFITPFVAVICGYIFLNESLNSNQILGFIFILTGIYIVKKSTNS